MVSFSIVLSVKAGVILLKLESYLASQLVGAGILVISILPQIIAAKLISDTKMTINKNNDILPHFSQPTTLRFSQLISPGSTLHSLTFILWISPFLYPSSLYSNLLSNLNESEQQTKQSLHGLHSFVSS